MLQRDGQALPGREPAALGARHRAGARDGAPVWTRSAGRGARGARAAPTADARRFAEALAAAARARRRRAARVRGPVALPPGRGEPARRRRPAARRTSTIPRSGAASRACSTRARARGRAACCRSRARRRRVGERGWRFRRGHLFLSRATARSACACRCDRSRRRTPPPRRRGGVVPPDPRRGDRTPSSGARTIAASRHDRRSTGAPAVRCAPRSASRRATASSTCSCRRSRTAERLPRAASRRSTPCARRGRDRRAARGLPAAVDARCSALRGDAGPGRARGQPAADGRALREYARAASRRSSTPRCTPGCTPRSTCSTGGRPAAAAATTSRSAGRRALRARSCSGRDLLASLITFVQHHPSLSYLFTGLFVGPDLAGAARRRGAPRRALRAGDRARAARSSARTEPPPPWLVDIAVPAPARRRRGQHPPRPRSASTSCSIRQTPHGRQGLVELRAFEMPPHPRMAVGADGCWCARSSPRSPSEPYRGAAGALGPGAARPLPAARTACGATSRTCSRSSPRAGCRCRPTAYRPFVELRCPVVGRAAGGRRAARGAQRDRAVARARRGARPRRAPRATSTRRWSGSRCARAASCRSATPCWSTATRCRCARRRRAGEHVAGVRFRAWAPPHSLQPHLGIHHPLRIDVVDTWAQALARRAARYHVWHPEGRALRRRRRSPASRPRRGARSASPSRGRRRGPCARCPPRRIPTRRTRSTCGAIRSNRPPPQPEEEEQKA